MQCTFRNVSLEGDHDSPFSHGMSFSSKCISSHFILILVSASAWNSLRHNMKEVTL
jgi:hypothetical protein